MDMIVDENSVIDASADVPGLHLHLSREEESLFDLLLRSVAFNGKSSTLRVAGGWVRDKILQKESHDIDIALDDQSGIEFANGVNAYLHSLGMETRTIAVIMANPDQSKHLETANLRVLGFEIDCVHLRAETYTDSRIPEVRVGTALEDALRRDFTINALFYNINTHSVEDFTGRGVSDLQLGVLSTPLPAEITFHDDPLRVLRAIRFASRLNYTLDPAIVSAARKAEIRSAMQHKVSKERICKEIDGMLLHNSSRPVLSAILLHHLHMLDICLPLSHYLPENPMNLPFKITRPAHSLCRAWFENETTVAQCEHCVLAEAHPVSEQSSCWMAMSVEVAMWIHVFSKQRQKIDRRYCHSSEVNTHFSDWIRHFLIHLVEQDHAPFLVTAADMTESIFSDSHKPTVNELNVNKVLFWSGLLSVTAGVTIQDAPSLSTPPSEKHPHKQPHPQLQQHRETVLCERILREQLKIDNHTAKNTHVIIEHAFSLLSILQLDSKEKLFQIEVDSCESIRDKLDILTVAQWLRGIKDRCEDALLLSLSFITAYLHRYHPRFSSLYKPFHSSAIEKEDEIVRDDCQVQLSLLSSAENSLRYLCHDPLFMSILERFSDFVRAVNEFRLQEIWLLKPLLDGGALQRAMEGKLTKGPVVGKLMEAQLLWLIQYRFSYASEDDLRSALIAHLQLVLANELSQGVNTVGQKQR